MAITSDGRRSAHAGDPAARHARRRSLRETEVAEARIIELAEKPTEPVRLREEYLVRFKIDPDIGDHDVDAALEEIRRSLDEGCPLPARQRTAERPAARR